MTPPDYSDIARLLIQLIKKSVVESNDNFSYEARLLKTLYEQIHNHGDFSPEEMKYFVTRVFMDLIDWGKMLSTYGAIDEEELDANNLLSLEDWQEYRRLDEISMEEADRFLDAKKLEYRRLKERVNIRKEAQSKGGKSKPSNQAKSYEAWQQWQQSIQDGNPIYKTQADFIRKAIIGQKLLEDERQARAWIKCWKLSKLYPCSEKSGNK